MLRINHSLSFKDACPRYEPDKMAMLSPNTSNYREVHIYWSSKKPDEVDVHLGNVNREAANGGYCASWSNSQSMKYSVNEILADGFSFDKYFSSENDNTIKMANDILKSFVVSLSALVTPTIIVNNIREAKKTSLCKP